MDYYFYLYNMEQQTIKRGPVAEHDFASYDIGHEIKILPLKQSSFKSMLSKFNKGRSDKHKYSYHQLSTRILAVRIA